MWWTASSSCEHMNNKTEDIPCARLTSYEYILIQWLPINLSVFLSEEMYTLKTIASEE